MRRRRKDAKKLRYKSLKKRVRAAHEKGLLHNEVWFQALPNQHFEQVPVYAKTFVSKSWPLVLHVTGNSYEWRRDPPPPQKIIRIPGQLDMINAGNGCFLSLPKRFLQPTTRRLRQ